MNGATTISIGSGDRLWVYSGAVLAVGATTSTIAGGNLAFDQDEPPGVYDLQNPANTTAGAYASDPLMQLREPGGRRH